MILTFKYRIKDATVGKYLDRHSRAVNFVWNYCCEIQRKVEGSYKAGAPKRRWARFIETDERWTSQACSDCGAVSGPKGIAQLGIRHWVCSDCGCSHDRDVNAARNILRVGAERRPPVEEIPLGRGRR